MLDRESVRTGLRAELFVADVAHSTRFYVEVLGFEVLRSEPGGYASLGRGGAVLGLNALRGLAREHPVRPATGERPGLGVEIVVMVDDVAAAHARAAALAVAGLSALITQPWGLTDFRLQDPDGYYIRLTSLSPPT